MALVGSIFSAILFAVLGVTAVSSEYASGMMRVTLTATPRRGRVLLAKAAVVTAVTLVGGLVATFAMFLCGQAVFDAYGLESASLGDPGVLRILLAGGALSVVFPVIGVALAFLLRSTAGAITTTLALIFAPALFGPLLPAWPQEHILAYLPGAASDSIAYVGAEDELMSLPPGVAVAVVAAWLVAFLAAAHGSLLRRDA